MRPPPPTDTPAPSRLAIFLRGATGKCPRCNSGDVFRSRYRLEKQCPRCGLPLEMEDGWSYGSVPLAYGLVGLFWVLPLCLTTLLGAISTSLAVTLGIGGVILLPILTYRLTKCLWTGLYYAILPYEIEDEHQP